MPAPNLVILVKMSGGLLPPNSRAGDVEIYDTGRIVIFESDTDIVERMIERQTVTDVLKFARESGFFQLPNVVHDTGNSPNVPDVTINITDSMGTTTVTMTGYQKLKGEMRKAPFDVVYKRITDIAWQAYTSGAMPPAQEPPQQRDQNTAPPPPPIPSLNLPPMPSRSNQEPAPLDLPSLDDLLKTSGLQFDDDSSASKTTLPPLPKPQMQNMPQGGSSMLPPLQQPAMNQGAKMSMNLPPLNAPSLQSMQQSSQGLPPLPGRGQPPMQGNPPPPQPLAPKPAPQPKQAAPANNPPQSVKQQPPKEPKQPVQNQQQEPKAPPVPKENQPAAQRSPQTQPQKQQKQPERPQAERQQQERQQDSQPAQDSRQRNQQPPAPPKQEQREQRQERPTPVAQPVDIVEPEMPRIQQQPPVKVSPAENRSEHKEPPMNDQQPRKPETQQRQEQRPPQPPRPRPERQETQSLVAVQSVAPKKPPVGWEHTQEIIGRLEEALHGKVLVFYAASDHPVTMADMRYLYSHLRKQGKKKSLYILPIIPQGEFTIMWRMATLLREFCDELTLLLPDESSVCTTLLSLSADAIYMNPFGYLSPVETLFQHPLLDKIYGQKETALPLREVLQSIQYSSTTSVKERATVRSKEVTQEPLMNSESLHPLILTAANRQFALTQMICTNLLKLSKSNSKSPEKVIEIVDQLTKNYVSNDYPIAYFEAQSLGLPVKETTEEVNDLLWDLIKQYLYITQPLLSFRDGHKSKEQQSLIIESTGRRTLYYREEMYDNNGERLVDQHNRWREITMQLSLHQSGKENGHLQWKELQLTPTREEQD